MLEPGQRTPKPILRQVVGWVVVLPLMVSFVRLPFPLGLLLALGALAASAYGAKLAWQSASRPVAAFTLIGTLLNAVSLFLLSTPSVLMALYTVFRYVLYPLFSNWLYGNF
ncbi:MULTISPECIES: hypothetical protein [Pseudomonas]|uniref:Uncharacterized protein n=2 Tax=Pseudomonas TaxID=286 RepID=A0A0W0I352_PSEFL|nr:MULTISPECIES: hypothetical protein [Pseudomonas]KTB67568.1 hypothetical protein AO063_16100 [Pseudomonas fluorescens ICMP 11288]MCF5547865.1 hypothetical protein [Pseudomonas salomonii]